jgi:hypothetical protein
MAIGAQISTFALLACAEEASALSGGDGQSRFLEANSYLLGGG